MLVLANAGPLTQQQLGRRLGIDRTTMVAAGDGLEAYGRVVRYRRPPDRPSNRVTITHAGQAVLAKADTALQHYEDEFVTGLTDTERATLMTLLGQLPHQEALLRTTRRRAAAPTEPERT